MRKTIIENSVVIDRIFAELLDFSLRSSSQGQEFRLATRSYCDRLVSGMITKLSLLLDIKEDEWHTLDESRAYDELQPTLIARRRAVVVSW